MTNQWVQANVALARVLGKAHPSAIALFESLRSAVDDWKTEGTVSRFFFQRKPPDLRLRLFGQHQAIRPRLTGLLKRACTTNEILDFSFSPYEPEQRKFGGAVAMDCVHAHWDADTRAWIALNLDLNQARNLTFDGGADRRRVGGGCARPLNVRA